MLSRSKTKAASTSGFTATKKILFYHATLFGMVLVARAWTQIGVIGRGLSNGRAETAGRKNCTKYSGGIGVGLCDFGEFSSFQ